MVTYTLPSCPASELTGRSTVTTLFNYATNLDASKTIGFDRFFAMGRRMYLFHTLGGALRTVYPYIFVDSHAFFHEFDPAALYASTTGMLPPGLLAALRARRASEGDVSASDAIFAVLRDEGALSLAGNKRSALVLLLARCLEYALWCEGLIQQVAERKYEDALAFATRTDKRAQALIDRFVNPANTAASTETVDEDKLPSPWVAVDLAYVACPECIRELACARWLRTTTPPRETETLFLLRALHGCLTRALVRAPFQFVSPEAQRAHTEIQVWLPVVQVYGFGIDATLLQHSIGNVLSEKGRQLERRLEAIARANGMQRLIEAPIDAALGATAASLHRFFSLRRTAAMTFAVIAGFVGELLLLDLAAPVALARPAILALYPVLVLSTQAAMEAVHLWPAFQRQGLFIGSVAPKPAPLAPPSSVPKAPPSLDAKAAPLADADEADLEEEKAPSGPRK